MFPQRNLHQEKILVPCLSLFSFLQGFRKVLEFLLFEDKLLKRMKNPPAGFNGSKSLPVVTAVLVHVSKVTAKHCSSASLTCSTSFSLLQFYRSGHDDRIHLLCFANTVLLIGCAAGGSEAIEHVFPSSMCIMKKEKCAWGGGVISRICALANEQYLGFIFVISDERAVGPF